MLILTRKIGERFRIGNDIFITNLGNAGSRSIRVGIEAPTGYNIVREELLIQPEIMDSDILSPETVRKVVDISKNPFPFSTFGS